MKLYEAMNIFELPILKMKEGKQRRIKESEMFFWGVFWGITIIGLEDISWVIKFSLFIILILAWIYYIFYPPPFVKSQSKVQNKQNVRRNLTILSLIISVITVIVIFLIRHYF